MATAHSHGMQGWDALTPDEDWHSSKAFHKAALRFHHKTTRFPREAIKDARQRLIQILHGIIWKLKELQVISRVEYTGSVYEGVKVDKSGELEFDLMLVLSGFNPLKEIPIKCKPGFYILAAKNHKNAQMEPFLDGEILMSSKVIDKLNSHITKILLQDQKGCFDGVSLRTHGPAVQLDIMHSTKDAIWFSVDMVPTIEIKDGMTVQRFVAKPWKPDSVTEMESQRSTRKPVFSEAQVQQSWRISYSLQEKQLLRNIDEGNKCHKQCLRILKALRDRDPPLHYIHSFILKNLILRNKESMTWEQKDLGCRVVDMLKKLADALDCGYLWHFINGDMNLLGNFRTVSMNQTAARVRELLRSETKLLALMENSNSPRPQNPMKM